MTRHIKLPLALGSTLAVLLSGCLLKIGGLDAGLEDDDESADSDSEGNCNGDNGDGDGDSEALECLIGTEVDAVGVAQSIWAPLCEVTCAEGWGHDGEQLPIAWTTSMPAYPAGAHHNPRAIGLLDSGRVVVAIVGDLRVGFQFFEPDGVNFGGFEVDNFGDLGSIQDVEIVSNTAYVTHSDGNDTTAILAVDLLSQQELWRTTFGGRFAPAVARGGDKVGFLLGLVDQDDNLEYELVVLDLDGTPLWSAPVDGSTNVAFSPSGEQIAVAGDNTRIYDAEDGDLIDELVSDPGTHPWAATFADEDRVIVAGGRVDLDRFDAWLAGSSLAGGSDWGISYNRATIWCPDPEELSSSTMEWLGDVTTLADGSLLAIGYESHKQDDVFMGQPWVVQFSAEGEYLASDRGLWNGYSVDTVAAPDGSVFVLFAGEGQPQNDPDLVIQDYWVRKYVP